MIIEYIYYLMVIFTLSSYAAAIDGLEVMSKKEIEGFESQDDGPCYSYTEINDPTRSVDVAGTGGRCDSDLAEGWYRFVGSGGNVLLNSCGKPTNCMWMTDDLPSLEEGEVDRIVCSGIGDTCCYNNYSWDNVGLHLKVKKCQGDYYVYYLKPAPVCSLIYCTTDLENINTPSDPCHSYTEIEEPDRSVDFGYVSAQCDIGLAIGWYRFAGSGGNIIPTSCVDRTQQLHCNTLVTLWMNGDLPVLEEGEVTRQVCGSGSDGNCCWSSNYFNLEMKVKKCEEYYVYFLIPPQVCEYRYCTDFINVPTSTISSILTTMGVTTETILNLETSIVCTEDLIEIYVKMDNLKTDPYAHLDDHSCGGEYNGSHVILATGLNQCGTQMKFPSATEIMYYNHVWYIDPETDGAVFSRSGEVKLLAECTYSRDQALSFGSFSPNYNILNAFVEGFGDISFSMSLYKASDFAESYAADDYPIQVEVGQPLYLEVSAHSSTPDLELLIASCKASTSDNSLDESALSDQLFENGCPTDDTVEFIQSNSTYAKRFSFEALVFLDRSSEVYLHCEAVLCSVSDPQSVCDLDCVDQAPKLKRRSVSRLDQTERHIITIGPLTSGS